MRQGIFRPKVQPMAWDALAAVLLQVPDKHFDDILNRIDPLIQRAPNTYTHMDKSILTILIRLHVFRPAMRERVSELILKCLADSELSQLLETFLEREVTSDARLREGVIEAARAGNRVCRRVLVVAGISESSPTREAEELLSRVLDYKVGENRTEAVVSDVFERAAEFATVLGIEQRDAMAEHLVVIGQDVKSPVSHRCQAIDALDVLADSISSTVRAEAFEAMLSLVGVEQSQHPIDQFAYNSMHPLSRFTFNISDENLNRAACETAGKLATKPDQAERLLASIASEVRGSDRRWLLSYCNMLYEMTRELRPSLSIQELAGHPDHIVRQLAVSLWVESPLDSPELGQTFARDEDTQVRQRLADNLDSLVTIAPDLSKELQTILLGDPSALVRATAQQAELDVAE
jgi:uncharacterized membrane protein